MPDGFDVRPETLRRGAADLRTDAGGLDAVRGMTTAAAQQTAGAAGTGPLTGAADEFGALLARTIDAARRSIEDCAGALDASATQYLTSDADSASRLPGVVMPDLDPPR